MTERTILRSPVTRAAVPRDVQPVLREAHVIVLNSNKTPGMIALGLELTRRYDARLYTGLCHLSQLNALEMNELWRSSVALVGNLAELHDLAALLGYDCPANENTASVVDIVAAIEQFVVATGTTADCAITLGKRIAVVYDAGAHRFFHLPLQPECAQMVQAAIAANPGNRNGAGDAFLGSFVLAYEMDHAEGSPWPKAVAAALFAAMATLKKLAPDLTPASDWFAIESVTPRADPARETYVPSLAH